jgi:hypothetical protein
VRENPDGVNAREIFTSKNERNIRPQMKRSARHLRYCAAVL